MGRVHSTGDQRTPEARITWLPEKATKNHVQYITKGNFIPKDLAGKYHNTTEKLIQKITPLFKDVPLTRIHGDCHYANLIYRPGESFYLIDFDDMAYGPPVQDFWMLLPGYQQDSIREINLFIEGYETFRTFNRSWLNQVEALRAMRYIHFSSWCAHQVADGGFSRLSPNWGSREYWQTEIRDLEEQMGRIQ